MARQSAVLFVAALLIVGTAVPARVSGQIDSIDDIISQAFQEAEQQVATAQAQAKAVSSASATGSATVVSSTSTATAGRTGSTSSTSSTSTGLVGGVSPATCKVLSNTNSKSCAKGQCCEVAQRTSACKGYLTATAKVNTKLSTCCVVLLDTKWKNRPGLFCAAPYKKGVNYQLPSSAKLQLVPSCLSGNGNSTGSSTCTVQLADLPNGWVVPNSKLESGSVGRVNPCGSGYKSFTQTTVNGRTLQSKCQ